jgi:opacity protein-like surface antigen
MREVAQNRPFKLMRMVFEPRFDLVPGSTRLWYGKAGGAWVQNSATASFINPVTGIVTQAASPMNSGWTVGTGLEWAFAPNWIGRLEYDYIGVDNWKVGVFNQFSVSRQINMFTAGLSYKF